MVGFRFAGHEHAHQSIVICNGHMSRGFISTRKFKGHFRPIQNSVCSSSGRHRWVGKRRKEAKSHTQKAHMDCHRGICPPRGASRADSNRNPRPTEAVPCAVSALRPSFLRLQLPSTLRDSDETRGAPLWAHAARVLRDVHERKALGSSAPFAPQLTFNEVLNSIDAGSSEPGRQEQHRPPQRHPR